MKLKPTKYSEKMGSRVEVYDGTTKVALLEVRVLRQGGQPIRNASEAVSDYVVNLQMNFDAACDRLFDLLLQDDGEAYSQGERFLKQHRPDLYNRIGMATTKPKVLDV